MKKRQAIVLGICRKCTCEKPVNKNSLCRDCDVLVDKELVQLFTQTQME